MLPEAGGSPDLEPESCKCDFYRFQRQIPAAGVARASSWGVSFGSGTLARETSGVNFEEPGFPGVRFVSSVYHLWESCSG